jgi:predicted alpha/beta hydrolase family esterase
MLKVFIIHGFEGHPNGGWRPWLMQELEKHEIYCAPLVMKDPFNPKSKEWVEEIDYNVKKFPKDKIVLVGHSLGVPAILKYLEQTDSKNILGTVLISGPYDLRREGRTWEVLGSFFPEKWDFKKILEMCKKHIVIHGDDDPVVSYSHAEFLADNLSGELINVKGGKHLNGSAGYFTLPSALEAILKIKD